MKGGVRVIEAEGRRVQLVEPWKAGQNDPPMQEWLRLPVGRGADQTICPLCGSEHFGTLNPGGYFLVRFCRDEHFEACDQRFRAEPDAQMIHRIVGALAGEPRRFNMGI